MPRNLRGGDKSVSKIWGPQRTPTWCNTDSKQILQGDKIGEGNFLTAHQAPTLLEPGPQRGEKIS